MIQITRLDGTEYYVNPHMIEFMEKTHTTVITMLSDKKILVKESCQEVIDKIKEYRKSLGLWANDQSI